MGLYLEDFELNVTHQTRGRTIGEGDVSLFAGLVGDFNPLHVDEAYCEQTIYGGRIVHGPLSLAVAIGLMSQLNWIDGTALGLLGLSWDFQAPVKLGDTIYARATPLEARPSRNPVRGILKIGLEVINQRAEKVQSGAIVLLMRRRAGEAALPGANESARQTKSDLAGEAAHNDAQS
ncbi:MAG TPA: MaoC/PaaZ C-terminal domain-containing protein [Roseiarcus sp.]